MKKQCLPFAADNDEGPEYTNWTRCSGAGIHNSDSTHGGGGAAGGLTPESPEVS